MRGRIEIVSSSSHGTTISVVLPRHHAPPPPPVVAAEQVQGERLRVLVVDDEPNVRAAIKVLLDSEHDVELVGDGESALGMIATGAYDVIFCDLMMPRMTGMEVLRAIRSDADPAIRSTRTLILSNSSKELEMHAADSLGVAGYWIKANLSLRELADRVEALLTPVPVEEALRSERAPR